MIRKIIKIDEDRCNGCGACAAACHEGAIDIVDGKARLMRENYCDGLGDCLPECPTRAIIFEEREAAAYDAAAVLSAKQKATESAFHQTVPMASQLRQWPCQIKLAPMIAPYFDGAELLIAADCTAYACANIHAVFMRGKVTLIGCPKLDAADYSVKLTEILRLNPIKSVTVLRMEVPCCGGLEVAVRKALQASGKPILCKTVTISVDGKILDN